MTWVRIDDGFAEHPKLLAAGPIAIVIQMRALCWSSRHLTDGFLPLDAVPGFLVGLRPWTVTTGRGDGFTVGLDGDEIDWPGHMVKFRLWNTTKGGWKIHDFLDYNPSKEAVLAERRIKSEAGKKGAESTNARRWGSAPAASGAASPAAAPASADGRQRGRRNFPRSPSPSPSPSEEEGTTPDTAGELPPRSSSTRGDDNGASPPGPQGIPTIDERRPDETAEEARHRRQREMLAYARQQEPR